MRKRNTAKFFSKASEKETRRDRKRPKWSYKRNKEQVWKRSTTGETTDVWDLPTSGIPDDGPISYIFF